MRAIYLALAAVLTTVGTAQAADADSTGLRRVNSEQLAKAKGSYELNDGRRAQLFVLDQRLYVRIGAGPQTELLLNGRDRFASRDGKVAVRFDSEADNKEIVLEHDADIDSQVPVRLASNERHGKGRAD